MVSLVGCPMPIFNAENMLATIGVQSAEAQTVLNITKLIIPQNEISVNTQKDEVEQNQLRTKPLTDTEVLRMAMDRLDTDEYTPSEKVTIRSLNAKIDKSAESVMIYHYFCHG